jgi:hypothetical protein
VTVQIRNTCIYWKRYSVRVFFTVVLFWLIPPPHLPITAPSLPLSRSLSSLCERLKRGRVMWSQLRRLQINRGTLCTIYSIYGTEVTVLP